LIGSRDIEVAIETVDREEDIGRSAGEFAAPWQYRADAKVTADVV